MRNITYVSGAAVVNMVLKVVTIKMKVIFGKISPSILVGPTTVLVVVLKATTTITVTFPAGRVGQIPGLFNVLFGRRGLVGPTRVVGVFSS